MDEEDSHAMTFRDVCCCCCIRCFPEEEKQVMTIEAYEPVIPEKKKYGYPQLQDEAHPLGRNGKSASDDERISSQPRRKTVNEDELMPLKLPRSRSIDTNFPKHGVAGGVRSGSVDILRNRPKPLNAAAIAMRKADPMVSITSPKTPKSLTVPIPHHATLQFNLYFDPHRDSLNIHVHQGLYFPPKKTVKSIDSYIKAILLPSKQQVLRTKIVSNSRSPAFDEVLEFSGLTLEELGKQTLVLQLFYRSPTNDMYISSCFTKLRYINLLESNHLTKRIDEGMGLLELSPSGASSLHEELQQLLDNTAEKIPKFPELHFTLYYSAELKALSVHLEKIIHLPTKKPIDSTDPYVVLYLLSRSERTFSTHKAIKTHTPMFDFMATFREVSREELDTLVLMFRVYVNHVNHFIGGVVYPLQESNYGSTIVSLVNHFPEEESFKDGIQGDLAITLRYSPEEKKMFIIILEAKMRNRKNAKIYVKVNLYHDGERLSKWKTSRKKTVLVFNEGCELDISGFPHDEPQLEVILLASEHTHFTHYHQVGAIWLGFDLEGNPTGEKQWRGAFDHPGKNISSWHPIFPPLPQRLSPRDTRSPSPSFHHTPSPHHHRHRSPSPLRHSPSPSFANRSRSASPTRSRSASPGSPECKYLESCPGLGQCTFTNS